MTMADSSLSNQTSSSSIDPLRSEASFTQTARMSASAAFGSPPSTIGTPSSSATMRLPMRTNPVPVAFAPKKRIVIRSDPTLVSCFDPADKELYELWAPKP